VLRELAERSETTPDALALAAVLRQPWADVVLSGAASVDTLESNLKALELDVSQGLEQLAEDPIVYWEERTRLPWN
jgi:aryl-alcohol dehydrogenase-like predicted oxidoreductase